MTKFNAATAVEPMEYDFTEYIEGAVGIIPEPSEAQVQTYFKTVSGLATEFTDLRKRMSSISEDDDEIDTENPDVAALMEEVKNLDMTAVLGQITEAVAALCSNEPSVEVINRLPFRVRQAFAKWVGQQFRSGQ